jgi:hypothetical protein
MHASGARLQREAFAYADRAPEEMPNTHGTVMPNGPGVLRETRLARDAEAAP